MKCGREHIRGPFLVHRLSHIHFIGPIPEDVLVLHECDVRPCFNPGHLFLGTHAENTQDAKAKGRLRAPGLPGETNHRAKLTAAQVAVIRVRGGAGERHRLIAADFDVTRTQVGRIVSGQAWAS